MTRACGRIINWPSDSWGPTVEDPFKVADEQSTWWTYLILYSRMNKCIYIFGISVKSLRGPPFPSRKKREKGVMAISLYIQTNTRYWLHLAAPQSVWVFTYFLQIFIVLISWNKAPLWGRPSTIVGHRKKKKKKNMAYIVLSSNPLLQKKNASRCIMC